MAARSVDRICADIMQGNYDSGLSQIIETITKKVKLGHIQSRWRIDCLGVNVAEDELLVDEAEQIELATDTDWQHIIPESSAVHFKAILKVLLRSRLDLSEDDAVEKMKTLTVVDAAKGISRELIPGDEGRAPLATDASTTTS